MKCMYVIGDSFSFGQELGGSDVPVADFYKFTPYMRLNSYTGIIADALGIKDYINKSIPGGSNDRNVRCLILDIPVLLEKYSNNDIFVIVNMTHMARREFYHLDKSDYIQLLPNHYTDRYDIPLHELTRIYTAYFSDYTEYSVRWLYQVISIQQMLENQDIKYLMINSLDDDTVSYEHLNNTYKHAMNLIDTVRYYSNISFHHFNLKDKLPVGKYGHPLEEGHREWANHLLKYIEEHNILGLL